MKQKFELGQKIWAFKQQGKDLVKWEGVIQSAEIDASGFIFYKVAVADEGKINFIMANHASMALTEEEIDEKMAFYHEFQEQQKKLFEEKIGAPEFMPEYIAHELDKGF